MFSPCLNCVTKEPNHLQKEHKQVTRGYMRGTWVAWSGLHSIFTITFPSSSSTSPSSNDLFHVLLLPQSLFLLSPPPLPSPATFLLLFLPSSPPCPASTLSPAYHPLIPPLPPTIPPLILPLRSHNNIVHNH